MPVCSDIKLCDFSCSCQPKGKLTQHGYYTRLYFALLDVCTSVHVMAFGHLQRTPLRNSDLLRARRPCNLCPAELDTLLRTDLLSEPKHAQLPAAPISVSTTARSMKRFKGHMYGTRGNAFFPRTALLFPSIDRFRGSGILSLRNFCFVCDLRVCRVCAVLHTNPDSTSTATTRNVK